MAETNGIGITRNGNRVHSLLSDHPARGRCWALCKETTPDYDFMELPPMLRCGTCERSLEANE